MFTKRLSKFYDIGWKNIFINGCMYAWFILKNIENMVRLSSTKLESRVTTPFGKDCGFICTCNKGSTKFPKFSTTSEYLSGDRYSHSNNIHRKVSFGCSIAYQPIQDYSWLATALRPKRPRWVKGLSYPNFWPKLSLTHVVGPYVRTQFNLINLWRFQWKFGREVF